MKLWQKDRQTLPNGTERIGVWRPVPVDEVKLGRKERLRNVQRLKAGETTFAIVRGFPDSHARDPFVYECDRLYKLGRVEVDPDGTEYAVVERVVSIREFLNRGATEITASGLATLLASLGAPVVLTKNNKPDAEKNYRARTGHPGDMLNGYWNGQPAAVEPGAAFALHLIERNQEIWLGDYLGAIEEEGSSRFSLIVGNAQRFHVTDLDFKTPIQQRLKEALKQAGAVTYSYIDPSHWDGCDENHADRTPEGPAYKMAQVKQRLHQRAFRAAVFLRHGKACVVTGCDVEELLEAAHLDGSRWQEGENTAQHGIPLRVDIHRAYDKGLLTLDQSHRIMYLDPSLEPQYGQYRQQ
ncbi:HNH endonuclease signature motif containing protein [Paraburkholderia azotifigens]|uniref:HNH endonuclease signature motif containing protein n=1 Tax=Paraburkholderia azotifigens TaxID=2057004 RepID=A0ABU9R4I6_9BURK